MVLEELGNSNGWGDCSLRVGDDMDEGQLHVCPNAVRRSMYDMITYRELIGHWGRYGIEAALYPEVGK